jgi:hypothetical protein
MGFWEGVTMEAVKNAAEFGFKQFEIGENECFIDQVNPTTAKSSGKKMLDIIFAKKDGAEIHYYITDDEYKLQKLKSLYTAFDIPLADQNVDGWKGKKGIVVCKQGEPYNGNVYPKVSYLKPINKDTSTSEKPSNDGFMDDIPF